MFRLRSVGYTFATVVAFFVLFSVCDRSSLITRNVAAQAQSQLVPLVTDQTPMALSNQFGVTVGGAVNPAGDYAFVGNAASAMFYRAAGTGAPVRVMQMGDEVPGFPGSRADIMQTFRLNNSGLLAFKVDFFDANGLGQGIIFTFDGTSLERVVAGNDPAPGSGGANFERSLILTGLNAAGDIAFTATLVPSGSLLPAQPTLYVVPGGGAPVRVAGIGDAAPGTGGTFGTLTPISFNNLGEELFSSTIIDGSGGSGLFVGSTTGVRKVVANGDTNPFGGTFPSITTGILNNAGQVAFQVGGTAIWLNTPANVTTRKVNSTEAAPASIGGTFNGLALSAFDDAGEIAFLAGVAGTAVTNVGLFRFRPSNPTEVVAYRNQAAPGAPGQSFSTSFTSISINATGVISFRATLAGGPILNGIFQQTGSNPPVNIALEGQATILSGGGSYRLGNSNTQTLANGSVYFRSDISGGTADYAEFLVSAGTPTVLMSTADPLPPGGRVSLRTFRVGAAGDSVGFLTQRTGGRISIAVHNITDQSTRILSTDGDPAPDTGGGLIRLLSRNTVFQNDGGSVVFSALVIGGSGVNNSGIFLSTPGGGISKIVSNGDVAPGTGGKTLLGSSLSLVTPSPINDAGQVVFFTTLVPAVPGPSARAVFVWSTGTGLSKVAAVGDVTSAGGTIAGFPVNNALSINSSGQVALLATTTAGPTPIFGIYIGSPGGTLTKVVAPGDPGPSGSTFSGIPSTASLFAPGFNDLGEVAFMSALSGGPGGGVFIGSASGPPVPLALSGDPAPSGGNFSITTARSDVLINNQHDVAFRASLTGGTADSGYFVRRGPAGGLQTAVLQGQAAPGTTGVFETIFSNPNGLISENFQLGPDGDLAFQNFFVASGERGFGTWHVKTDNAIEEILVRGSVAPEFGGGSAVISTPGTSWNSGGRYPVWARISGGTFTEGIFLFVPTVSTNTPAGTSVPVNATDSTTGTTPVALNFASVTEAGDTTLTTSSGGPAIPTAFALGNPPVFYNIETTATFAGSIGVCIDFSSVSFPPGSNLRLLHFEGGAWVDVTTSGPTGSVICGSVTSLSPFTVVQVLNSPPVADAGADQTVECGGSFTLNGSGSTDPDHDTLSYVWKDGNGDVVGNSASVVLSRPVGNYTFTLTVTDGFNPGSTATTHVTVTDNTAPELTVDVSPNSIGPPNKKMVQITASIQVSDTCSTPQVELVSITCNEQMDSDDIQGATFNTDDRSFTLKATREGGGNGRIYTITYRATDASGNVTTTSAQVSVPHDQGH